MRSDMAQVLIERPRSGSRVRGYRRQRRIGSRGAIEDQSSFEAIRRRLGGRDKFFSDLFGPLARFLNRNVGRPWNKVFSEICRHARLDNVAQQHLRRHVFDLVETHVMIVDGVPCHSSGWRIGQPLVRFGRKLVYVCPKTGLLRNLADKRPKKGADHRILVDKELQYHRIDGIWYEVRLRPIPEDCAGCFDALIGKPVARISKSQRISRYGFEAYALSTRPLSRREARTIVAR